MLAIRARNCVPGSRTWPVMSTAAISADVRCRMPRSSYRTRIIPRGLSSRRSRLRSATGSSNCAAADLAQPELLADELFLLLEGARVTAQSMGRAGLGERLIRMGEAMIAAHRK